MSKKTHTIFMDMDGVLADFVAGVKRVFGLPDPWECTRYALYEQPEINLSADEFWKRLDSTVPIAGLGSLHSCFWQNLPPVEGGVELALDLARKHKVIIITRPVWNPDCSRQKIEWLHRHVGPVLAGQAMIDLGGNRELLAAPGRILIDDFENNCIEWEEAGGIPMLVATTYNREPEQTPVTWTYEQIRRALLK